MKKTFIFLSCLCVTMIGIAGVSITRPSGADKGSTAAGKPITPVKHSATRNSFSPKEKAGQQAAPLAFIENKGQIADQYNNPRTDIQYRLAAAGGLNIFVGNGAIHYQFSKIDNQSIKDTPGRAETQCTASLHRGNEQPSAATYTMYRMDVELVGANKSAKVECGERQEYYENYLTPGTGDKGATAKTYGKITYKDVYPHIDWVLYTRNGKLEHEFVVRQGGKAGDIKLKYGGATGLKISADGNLVANTPQGAITENAPYTYQQDGKKVSSSFKLNGDVLSYETGSYTGDLVIDPSLVWATYYGGAGSEEIQWNSVTTDGSGNVYISATTTSTSSIATLGAYNTSFSGANDVFLAKFNSAGAIQWATYYGGSVDQQGDGVATDGSGNVYISGRTSSTSGIATPGAYQTALGGAYDGFLAKFNSSGAIQWATYYGGSGFDFCESVATDASGNVYIAGATESTSGIATPGAFQTTYAGGVYNGFLVQFNSAGVRQWGTYYGGSGSEIAQSVTTDVSGNVYIAGGASSTSGVASPGAYQTTLAGGGSDAFLAKFNSSGVRQWGTYCGGTLSDEANGVATDGSGNVYISGFTASTSGIATAGAYQSTYGGGPEDGFVVKFNSSGARQWGTYFGGSGDEQMFGLTVDVSGNVYVPGYTSSTSGIATAGAYQVTYGGGGDDGVLAEFDTSGNLQWATYYGGSGVDNSLAVATDGTGNVFMFGYATSTSGISTPGAYHTAYGGGSTDAFLVKFNCSPGVAAITGPSTVCVGNTITLSDTRSGGIWSSSATSIATVGTSGIVTGVTNGLAIISYSVTNFCGTTVVTAPVYVGSYITTIAGTPSVLGYSGDNGPATAAKMNGPWKAVKDAAGNIYMTDQQANLVRKINAAGIITTIAGGGVSTANGVPATNASLYSPYGIAVDAAGNVYIADHGTNTVRKVNTSGIISTFAGGGASSADGVAATSEALATPGDIVIDGSGNFYISDLGFQKIRKVNPAGIITTIAGTGTAGFSGDGGDATSAKLHSPFGLSFDGAGNLYFVDELNYRIRMVNTSGIITTIGGNGSNTYGGDGLAATAASMVDPEGVAVDGAGNVFVADNGDSRIREISSSGIMSTFAGNGTNGYNGDGAPATTEVYYTSGLSFDAAGTMYISDHGNRIIRTAHFSLPKPGTITGNLNVCPGNTTALTDITATGTGTWSSSATAVATVGSTGVVTGVSNGFATITYTVSNGCGSNVALATVNVGVPLISTIAGNGTSGYTGDNGPATSAQFNAPYKAVTDGTGNLYVSDVNNNVVRKVSPSGIITNFAGNGTIGYTGDNGPATAAQLNQPYGLATDASGNVYIGTGKTVRKVSPSGIITTFAGKNTSGYSGDNGPATAAQLYNLILDLQSDAAGNIYIVDGGNNVIRKVNTSGIITTVAGNGTLAHGGDGTPATTAQLYTPVSVAVDGPGNIYIGELGSGLTGFYIRKVNTSGIISTIEGTGVPGFSGDGGPATAAQTQQLYGLTTDAAGNIYIADYGNGRIRQINPSGIISTIAGGGAILGDGGPATAAFIQGAMGVSIDASGAMYIVDYGHNRVRKVNTTAPNPGAITGNFTVCPGSTTALTDTTGTGTAGSWSSSTTTVATVGSTGLVTGVSTGTATITYTASNGCGSNATTATVYVGMSIITTVAGTGYLPGGYTGDNGPATAAELNFPWSMVTDATGNLYISDQNNFRIRKVNTSGIITTFAGTGSVGTSGDGGAATAAKLDGPLGITTDAAGNVYVTTASNIRKINTSGIISTVAGGGLLLGDGGPATAAIVDHVRDVEVDAAGNIYIADYGNNRVRKINTSGIITTIAGNGAAGHTGDGTPATASKINGPESIALDAAGNLYIGEDATGNFYVRKVNTSGIISTIAGIGTSGYSGDGGAATAAAIAEPRGLSVDASGNIYIADYGNLVIREINTSGIISTVAGGGSSLGDGGPATAAQTVGAAGVFVDHSGTMYIADYGQRIRKINSLFPSSGAITGTVSICPGNTATLSDATTGGVWSSSATSVATVGSTGIVTGIASGTATISYSVSNGCGANPAVNTVTVNPAPGAITGGSNVCIGAPVTLSDAGGGSWASSNTSFATVGSGTGVVTGVAIGTATITYTLPVTGCFTASVVTIGALPSTPSAITGTPTVCAGSATTTLSDPAVGGAWSSTNTTNATIGSTGIVTGLTAGTTTISYAITNTCGSKAATVTVTINPLPTAPAGITGTTTVCAGGATTALSDVTAGGVWSSTNSTNATVGTTGIVTGSAAGTSIISYTYTNSCGSLAATATVTVNPLPANPAAITGTATVCTGSATTQLSDVTVGGVWSSTNTTNATVSGSGLVTGLTAGTTTISYTETNSCGSMATTTVVTINPLPAIPAGITGTATVCAGSATTQLSDVTGGGVWTSANTTSATVSVTGLVTGLAAGTSLISYTETNSCGSNAATVAVTINPLPTSPTPITGTTTICETATTALSDITGGGAWTSSNTSNATVDATGLVTGVAAGTSAISYSYSNSCGSAAVAATVTVNPLPTVPASITGTPVVCAGGATTSLTDATTGGVWSSTNTGSATIGITGLVTGVTTGTTTISYTYTNTCGSAAATRMVLVNPLPLMPVAIAGTATVCAGGATTALSDGTAGGAWSSSNTSAASIDALGTVTGVAAGTSLISYTFANSCGSKVVTDVVTVNPLPAVPASITGTPVVCAGGATTSLSDVTGGGVWSSTNSANATVGATGIVTGVTAGASLISYTYTNSCGSAAATTIVTVNPLPVTPAAITGSPTVCAGGAVTFLSDVTGGGAWSSSNTVNATVTSTGMVTGLIAGTSMIFYTYTNSCGSASATAAVTVNPLPGMPVAITGTTTVCAGGATILLNDFTSGGVWSSSNTVNATVSGSGLVTGLTAGTSRISYTATNGCGSASATTLVTINPLPAIPAAITGSTALCTGGGTTALSDITAGGVWSSSNTVVATVTTSGMVTGMTPGVTTIAYTETNSCGSSYVTTVAVVTALPDAGAISGVPGICAGTTTTLTETIPEGVWSSSNTVVATVGSTGVVTGLSKGTDVILYSVSNLCGIATATVVLSIDSLPDAGAIAGSPSVCAGASTTLSDAIAGGAWHISNANATIAGGVVTGVTTGIDTVIYTVTNGCGSAPATRSITINPPLPPAGALTGLSNVCVGGKITLADTIAGGAWSANNSNATVTGGVVTGVAADTSLDPFAVPYTSTIIYSVTNLCGTATATKEVTIAPLPLAFTVMGGGSYCEGGNGVYVWLSNSEPHDLSFYQLYNDTTHITDMPGMGASFNFGRQTAAGNYTVIATNGYGCSRKMPGSVTVTVLSAEDCNTLVTSPGLSKGAVTVLPNPNKGTFTIRGSLGVTEDTEVSIELTDMLGQVVYKGKGIALNGKINEQVKLANTIASGMYLLSVHSAVSKNVFHIVVEQ
jgi:uncharacterized protein YjdB